MGLLFTSVTSAVIDCGLFGVTFTQAVPAAALVQGTPFACSAMLTGGQV